MASRPREIVVDMSPSFHLYEDGTITRFYSPRFQRTSEDAKEQIRSKDVVVVPETGVSVRIFLPGGSDPSKKLPLVVYIHGGAFCVGSASSVTFHNFVAKLVENAEVVAVSVDYRLAPEFPLPIPYEDSWEAFQWVMAHSDGRGADCWLNEYADFQRVYIGGESAGANIANDVAMRAGVMSFPGVGIAGMFLIHPFFGGKDLDMLYKTLCPESSGLDDDPRLNPVMDPRIRQMTGRVLFFVAEKDFLRNRGRAYYERLKTSEWKGEVDIMETEGEDHCFYLFNTTSEKAAAIINRLVVFFKNT